MMRRLAVVALLALAVAAQEPLRDRAFGEVRDAAGAPFAGATVHLLHRVHPYWIEPLYEDHVEATTDARGRFHAQLLAGMGYAVWAVGPVVGGTYRCTEVLAEVVPGVPIVLREGEVHCVRQFTVAADLGWSLPLQFVVSCQIAGLTMQQEVQVVDGVMRTPAWPVDGASLLAFAAGMQVHGVWLPLTVSAYRDQQRRLAAAANDAKPSPDDKAVQQELTGVEKLTVPARHAYSVRLVDARQRPVAGVELFAEGRSLRLLGVADADGLVTIATTADKFPFYGIIARCDGCAESRLESEAFHEVGEPVQDVSLAAGTPVHGRLLLDAERPAAAPLLLNGSICLRRNSTYFGLEPRLLTAANDGRFVAPGRVPGYGFRLTALLTATQRAALSPDKQAPPLWPRAIVLAECAGAPADVGDLRLDRLAMVDVHVSAADGVPPGSVQLVVLPLPDGQSEWPHYPERMRTDRRGALRFLLPRGLQVAVCAMTEQGAAMGIAGDGVRTLELQIDPRHVARFRVVDQKGNPIGAAMLDIVTPKAMSRQVDARASQHISDAFMVHGFPFKRGRTDGEGRATLVMPLLDATIDLVVYGKDNSSMRLDIPFSSDHPIEPLELPFEPNRR